jgi:hypothetical protein
MDDKGLRPPSAMGGIQSLEKHGGLSCSGVDHILESASLGGSGMLNRAPFLLLAGLS